MTEWRSIEGYEGVYEVSDDGDVRRVAAGRGAVAGKLLKPRVRAKGYLRVILHYGPQISEHSVHRLVASAFLQPPLPGQTQVNHRDGNTGNNAVTNLEWATGIENVRHAFTVLGRTGHQGEANGRARLTNQQVRAIRELQGSASASEVGRQYGVSNVLIGMIWRRQVWRHLDVVDR
jgi:NUMOD4 motif-containing protein/HNH endonuclease